ncbi:hypothetical protein O6H91_14G003500 [Diphasiastrum complanatum]|uniref:Uncharacterized protein n=1 Tax=Diphasiastrum complanatum TaxID=34168 RepID=A0ACC2BKZ1_DIPCM|nr:hypothetical protein O6H91_14G003500 [Diphasiastrum complanatum]
MVSASKEMAVYCFDILVAHYTGDLVPPPAFEEGYYPLFVTWKKVTNAGDPRLRGCIGTLEARYLFSGFKDYAISSALHDRRFPPIQSREVPCLECTVSLLTDYEHASSYLDWEIGKHGMILEFTDPNNSRCSATYLPEVAAQEGWTKVETIDSLVRKTGYMGPITESLRRRFHITRYQSSLYTMHYCDYIAYVKRTRGIIPVLTVRDVGDLVLEWLIMVDIYSGDSPRPRSMLSRFGKISLLCAQSFLLYFAEGLRYQTSSGCHIKLFDVGH